MTTYYSKITYTNATGGTEFSIPFEYLEQSHVKVTLDGVEQTNGVDYTINESTSKVVFGSATTAGDAVVISRTTPIATDDLAVTFTDGSGLNAEDLNDSTLQNIFANQELRDDVNDAIDDVDESAAVVETYEDRVNALEALAGFDSDAVPIDHGGTGATTESDARTNLGLGTIATQDSDSVSISGGSISGAIITATSITGIPTGRAISIVDYGAVGDGTTDCTSAITSAIAAASSAGLPLFIPAGEYKILSVISCDVPIYGEGPTSSIIYNAGTGDALNLNTSSYYSSFRDFSVKGNASSRDGITLVNIDGDFGVGDPNASYCLFENVHSHSNGRHGLNHRMAWATRYAGCKFYSNSGLGILVDTQSGDLGTANCVTFMQCDIRSNGGSTSGLGSDNGGIKISGAAGVSISESVIESNNGFGVYAGSNTNAVRNVHISRCYLEYNGWGVSIGATLYAFGAWANITVENCWIAYGSESGDTHYLFNITASTDNGNFSEKNNTLNDVGTGGTTYKFSGTQFSQANNTSKNTLPTCKAYYSGTLTVADSTATKIPFNTEIFDTNGDFDVTTNNRFTPTCPGYYQINATANYFTSVGSNGFISIYKNGAEHSRGPGLITGTSVGLSVSDIVYCNGTTDYIEIYVFQASGTSQDYTPGAGLCFVSGGQIR